MNLLFAPALLELALMVAGITVSVVYARLKDQLFTAHREN